jgi:type VI secretion system protein ImpA
MTETNDPNESPPVVDVAVLVAPIPGDAPAGADLRTDPDPNSPYRRLKAAREAAREAERRTETDPEAPAADWSEVNGLAVGILSTASKDLEVAAWLVEGLLRENGFAGLRDGLRVTREICDAFWDGLHPAITPDGGIPDRVFAFTGLNGETRDGLLVKAVRLVPFAEGPSGQPWSLWSWEMAVDSAGKPPSEEGGPPPGPAVADVEEAVRAGDGAFYRTFVADLGGAMREFAALGESFDRLCAGESPPRQYIKGVMEKYDEAIRHLARMHLDAGKQADGAGAGAAAGAGGARGGGGGGPLQSREDAFRLLESVADYFRRTEPHSPLSYSLEQAVRWGRMPLPDLLAEIVPDAAARDQLFRLTGIRPPAPPAPQ